MASTSYWETWRRRRLGGRSVGGPPVCRSTVGWCLPSCQAVPGSPWTLRLTRGSLPCVPLASDQALMQNRTPSAPACAAPADAVALVAAPHAPRKPPQPEPRKQRTPAELRQLAAAHYGSPSLQLQPGGGPFSLHAYAGVRPLTQLDFISTGRRGLCACFASFAADCVKALPNPSTPPFASQAPRPRTPIKSSSPPALCSLSDDLDDHLPTHADPTVAAFCPGSGSSAAFCGGGAGLGPEARRQLAGLGMPSMEDLRRMLLEPMPPAAFGSGDSSSSLAQLPGLPHYGLPGAGSSGLQFVPVQQLPPANYLQPLLAAGSGFGASNAAAPAEAGQHPMLRPAVLRIKTGAGGGLKRRGDALGRESEADSPRGSKRHSGGSAWSEGSADNEGDTPRSMPRGQQGAWPASTCTAPIALVAHVCACHHTCPSIPTFCSPLQAPTPPASVSARTRSLTATLLTLPPGSAPRSARPDNTNSSSSRPRGMRRQRRQARGRGKRSSLPRPQRCSSSGASAGTGAVSRSATWAGGWWSGRAL